MLEDIPSRIVRNVGRYAVLLNARAKQWTGDLHHDIQRWVPSKDLFLTDDFQQAERTVDRLLDSDYDFIFTGGGDGTIVYLHNAIRRRIESGQISRDEAPPVGVLRMGTGNALATFLECADIVDDLRALRNGSPVVVYDLHLLRGAEGEFPFAGFGWDALILNDYDAFKAAVRNTAFENYATGLGGYAASVLTRSIPNAMSQPSQMIRVTNHGDDAFQIDMRGRVIDEFEEGDVIFEGPIRVTSAATEPYWGFGIRMFPHCTQKPGYFEYRAFNGSIPSVLLHLPSFWRGSFSPEACSNFLCTHIEVEILDGAMPYHVAGDPEGYERDVEWRITDGPAQFAVPLH